MHQVYFDLVYIQPLFGDPCGLDWINKGFIYACIAWLAEEGGLLEKTFKSLGTAISVGSNNLNFFF